MRGIAPDAKIKLVEAAIFLFLLYPLTSRYGAPGAAWAGALAFFVVMINRLRVAASLLPNVAGLLVRTVLSAAVACALGITLGELAIWKIDIVLGRLLLGGSADRDRDYGSHVYFVATVASRVVAGFGHNLLRSTKSELAAVATGSYTRLKLPDRSLFRPHL